MLMHLPTPIPTVSPAFFRKYVVHVCPLKRTYKTSFECLAAAKAPALADQIEISRKFDDLAAEHRIDGLEGVILLLMMREKNDTLDAVVTAADVPTSLDFLRAVTSSMQSDE